MCRFWAGGISSFPFSRAREYRLLRRLIYQGKIAHLSGALVRGENYSMLRVAGTIFSTHARFWIFICRRKIIKPFSLRKISFPSNLNFFAIQNFIYIYICQSSEILKYY
jgi:hypothetical protein